MMVLKEFKKKLCVVIIVVYALTYGFNIDVSYTLITIHTQVEWNKLCGKSCMRS